MSAKISALLNQLAPHIPEEQQPLLDQLREEVTQLITSKDNVAAEQSSIPVLDKKSGCYRKANNASHYCPQCFDNNQNLVATQRINSKLRVCPQCRESIKPTAKK